MADSTIRLRQFNQAELSGYCSQITSGILSNSGTYVAPTGKLTGAFYPLDTNPAGYAKSGDFSSQSDIDSSIAQNNSYIDSTYYPRTNPSGYTSLVRQTYPFSVYCTSGATSEYFPFPVLFSGQPRVVCSFVNNINQNSYFLKISGISDAGFYVTYSDNIDSTGYSLDVVADLSSLNPKSYSFEVYCTSGANQQNVLFPIPFSSTPRVICSFLNNVDDFCYGISVFGVTSSGFSVNYSNYLSSSLYKMEVLASV